MKSRTIVSKHTLTPRAGHLPHYNLDTYHPICTLSSSRVQRSAHIQCLKHSISWKLFWGVSACLFLFSKQGAQALDGNISPAAHIVFVFHLGGGEPSEAASEGPFTERLKTQWPCGIVHSYVAAPSRTLDIKSKQTFPMTVSLPEPSAPTTWTTQAASERFFDDFPSSCHHPQLARRRAAAALGRPAAAASSLAGMVRCQTLRMVGAVVSVGLVAKSTFRTCICLASSWVGSKLCTFARTLYACMPCGVFDAAVALHALQKCSLLQRSCPTVWVGRSYAQTM